MLYDAPIIAKGTKRIIYDRQDAVLKVPIDLKNSIGVYENLDEIKTYEKYQKIKIEDRIIKLGEILEYEPNGSWILMKKYKQEDFNELSTRFKELYYYIPIIDYNIGNLALDEQYNSVLIDYHGFQYNVGWFSKKENAYLTERY